MEAQSGSRVRGRPRERAGAAQDPPLLAQREPARPLPQRAVQVASLPCFFCVPAPSRASVLPGGGAHTPVHACVCRGCRSLPHPHPHPSPASRLWAPAVWLLSALSERCGYSQETCLPARSCLGLAPSSFPGHSLHPLNYSISFIRPGLAQSESPSSRPPSLSAPCSRWGFPS